MSQPVSPFPARFLPAIRALLQLQQHERYLGAIIFGSLARMEATDKSDCDAKVIVNEENPCSNINHPSIGGVKLDLTFLSLEQLRKHTREEMERAERIPIIAKSIILFGDTPVP